MIGVVLAGGSSSRFGGASKGLALFGGKAMASHVAEMLAQVCTRVAIESPSSAGYEALGIPLLHAPNEHAGKGPLAGLAAGLAGLPSGVLVAFAPCDMPMLTRDVYDALKSACENGGAAAYAKTQKGVEPLVAVLRSDMRDRLIAALERDELPRTHAVLDVAGAKQVTFADAAPFENVNTPLDLERLRARW